jgi:CYTH domain-containing protein
VLLLQGFQKLTTDAATLGTAGGRASPSTHVRVGQAANRINRPRAGLPCIVGGHCIFVRNITHIRELTAKAEIAGIVKREFQVSTDQPLNRGIMFPARCMPFLSKDRRFRCGHQGTIYQLPK